MKNPRKHSHLHKPRTKFRKPTIKPIPRVVVPSFFTLMNLFCGFLAIIYITDNRMEYGAWLIVVAGLFDALDGFMARLSNATSDFGIELDSLSDVVSFGVAPGILMYHFALEGMQFVGLILAALPALCGAVRLARFNVEAQIEDSDFFKGLPIPAQAMMLVAFFLIFRDSPDYFTNFRFGTASVLIPYTVVLSFLMVTTVPFDKTPRFNKKYLQEHKYRVLLFIGYVISIIAFQEWGIIATFSVFILKGLFIASRKMYHALQEPIADESEDF